MSIRIPTSKILAAPTVALLIGVAACVIGARFGLSNCLFWSVDQYRKRGGYLIARKSHWGNWPHFAWSADLKTYEAFVPLEGQNMDVFLPYPLFRGRIKFSTEP